MNGVKCDEHKLFIFFFLNRINDTTEEDIDNIIKFNNKFSKYTKNYTLLTIFNLCNKSNNHHAFTYNDNIHFLELHTKSKSNSILYDYEYDNIYLDNIIKQQYDFKLLPIAK
jgi:hypothetical protein